MRRGRKWKGAWEIIREYLEKGDECISMNYHQDGVGLKFER